MLFSTLEYSLEDFNHGLIASDVIVPEDSERSQENIQKTLAGEDLGGMEYTAQRKDGSTFPILTYASPILHEGILDGLRGIAVDITELKKIDQMKTEFVSVASHELKTPLTSIKGYVDLIIEGDTGEINETQKEFLGIVQTETNRLSTLVANLLDVARIESGRLKLEIGTVLLDDIVKDAIISIQPLATDREVRFITHLLQKPMKVMADRDRIEQVLINLFSNAINITTH